MRPAADRTDRARRPAERTEPVREVLEEVARDARKAPRQYLDETKVPGGGE
jgi:hypothetical protein